MPALSCCHPNYEPGRLNMKVALERDHGLPPPPHTLVRLGFLQKWPDLKLTQLQQGKVPLTPPDFNVRSGTVRQLPAGKLNRHDQLIDFRFDLLIYISKLIFLM